MTKISVSATLPADPEKTWATLADPARFEEWLTLHQGWRGPIPAEITVGTTMTEVVAVMGMANKIEWTVEEYAPPKSLRISGTGMAGVKVSFTLSVTPQGTGSVAEIDAEFTGQMIVGPIGAAIGKNTRGELEKSLARFAELVA
ncbi:type II toxin-antitoxin system Rv0910 family toxin [Actinokineospora iranica]|uniref:Polyketide cyclase / dehydrase and lipid transport n=1 Tax=Actinokineospora iranica TaxID=1271860 RepID=A0A1G6RVV8_9PSEU|nr:SRPBCC family protein [Actinokineospora iranica]SDD08076.1 Polyketide cyclase / dehydrase and lipid transport [Actinokineospora iranica]